MKVKHSAGLYKMRRPMGERDHSVNVSQEIACRTVQVRSCVAHAVPDLAVTTTRTMRRLARTSPGYRHNKVAAAVLGEPRRGTLVAAGHGPYATGAVLRATAVDRASLE